MKYFDVREHEDAGLGCGMYWHDRMLSLRRLHAVGLRLEGSTAAAGTNRFLRRALPRRVYHEK